MQRVDGEQLLNTNEDKAIHEFKIEDDEDRKIFMQELDLLKEYHSLRRKSNIIEEADRMDKESSQYIQSFNMNQIKMMPMHNQIDQGADFDDENDYIMSDSSIQQFEDNDSTINRKLLEEEIKMIVRMLQQCGGDKMQNSTNGYPSNEASQRYGMTISKPYVLSQNNLATSTASLQQQFAASADYQSQLFSESLSMSKLRIPYFFDQPNNRTNEEDERISEVQSYQENLSTIPLSHDERLQLIAYQSLIIKDCLDQEKQIKPKFYEIFSNEASVGSEGNISVSQSSGSKRKLGIFKFNSSCKNSKQEFSLTNQQTVNLGPNSMKCNWSFKSLNSQSLIALQVVKRVLVLEDTFIMGNHTIAIKKMENLARDNCSLLLQIRRLDDQLYFNNIQVSLNPQGIFIGKHRKTCTIYLDNDKEVSSNHCKMVFDPIERCAVIVDNASTNGQIILPSFLQMLHTKFIQINGLIARGFKLKLGSQRT